MAWVNFLWIGAGASLGACCRYLLTLAIPATFPWATLAANVAGSLLIGMLIALDFTPGRLSEGTKLMLVTGFCGSLTTFSTFSSQTLALMQSAKFFAAGLNIVLNLGVTLFAVWLGLRIGIRLFGQ